MSDEEKKAIEMLRNYDNEDNLHKIHQSINVVLNLIEKQQKEIEELKEEREYLNCIIESDKDNYINKDKIKAKIEFIKSLKEKFYYEENVISILQSLLEKE